MNFTNFHLIYNGYSESGFIGFRVIKKMCCKQNQGNPMLFIKRSILYRELFWTNCLRLMILSLSQKKSKEKKCFLNEFKV